MKRISFLLAAAFCVGIISTTASATTFFSQASLAPNLTASWDSIRAGGGSAPANFTSGDTFVIQNTHNMGTTAAWTVSGAGATIQIESGGTLTANNIVAVPTFQVDNGGSYVHNTASGAANGVASDVPGSTTRTFGASSTVEFQKWANGGTGPVALPSAVAWGNLIINVTLLAGSWQQSGGLQTVNGNLTIQQTGGTTREFRLNANSPATSTFNLTGNLQVSGGIFNITSGTAVETFNIGGSFSLSGGTFTATGAGPHSMNFTGGTSSVTFSQPGAGTFTVTNINFTIASGKTVTLNSDFPLGAARSLTVTGTLDQGASFNLTTGTSTTISSGGQLKNLGTGDLTLGGNVTNNGTVNLNGGGVACGDADSILIRSSVGGTQRSWSGGGTFTLSDVDVQDQAGSATITVLSGTDSGNNGANWVFVPSCVLSQTYTWQGPTLGDDSWTNPMNWTPTRTTPDPSDVLVFDGSTILAPTVSGVPTETIARLRIINGANPTFSSSGSSTLTIAGGTGIDLEMVSLTLTGTNPITISVGAGATGSVSGTMIVQGGAHRLIATDGNAVTFASGSAFTTGTGFSGNPFGSNNMPVAAPIVFASGSGYFHNAGADPFGAGVFLAVEFQPGSTETYSTTAGFSSQGRFYGNLVLTGNQIYSHSGTGTLTVQNGLTIESGSTLNHTSSSSAGIVVSEALTIKGALIQSSNVSAGSVAVFLGGSWSDVGSSTNTFAGNITNNGTISFNGGTPACGDADTILLRSSLDGTPRTWSGTGVFDFTDVDVRDQSSGLSIFTVSSTDSGNNTGWTFQSSCGPSAARLSSFGASRYEDGTVLLEWQTGFEVDNLGYNIYRDEGGKRARLTPQLIAGSALLAGPRVSLKAGRSYAWTDSLAEDKVASYWLEEVDLNGVSTWHGPFAVVRARQGDQLPSGASVRAVLLSGLTAEGARQLQTNPVALAAKPVVTTAAGLAIQSDLATASALKLAVRREGLYRVSAAELIAAGLDSGIDPRNLRLYADGQEQPIIVKGEEDGTFDPEDGVEFYGLGLDTAATDTRIYWLAAGFEPGRRILQVKGKGSRAAPSSLPYTVERKDRTTYFAGLRNGGKENFFGAVIARNPVDQLIRVEHLDSAAQGDATLEVALQGVTELAHRVKVELNGTPVGELSFTGQKEGVATFALSRGQSQAALKEGQNTVRLTPLGAERDVSLVDYIRITYPHTYTADNNSMRFTLSNKQQVTIDGFTNSAIRVLDITDPNEIRQVSARVQQQDGGYSVTVSAPKPGGRTLWALTDDQASRVAAITPNRPSNLRDAENTGDFVIVAHREFLESVKPLQKLRESQGLNVTVVDVEDVYDEFGYGDKSPQAIKDFLSFAKTNWRTPPRFALFVGDASLDPKNYQGRGDYDFVPSRFVDTALMETASDEWLADFDGNGLAEMALGRLPVRTAGEASRVIDKIISYDSAPRMRDILLVSDLNDGIDFQSEVVQVRALVPAGVNVAHIDREALGTTAAKSELIESLNRGFGIVSYFGHGNVDQWRGDLLTSADAGALANGEMRPVVFAITCLNGYFQDPILESLAESLMKAERGGAVAVLASSGMCDSGPQAILDQELFRVMFDGSSGALTLGEAAMRAKNSINDSDVRLTYILFGDPTTRLR